MSGEGRDNGRELWRERFDDLKDAYALGALTEDERQEFDSYLAAHPELQAEVDDLHSVANLLSLAPQEYEPPPELRRNLLSRIEGAANIPVAEASSPRTRLRSIFGPGGLAAASIAAAASLVVVGLFVWNVSLRGENEDLRGELRTPPTYEMQGSGVAQNVRGEVIMMGEDRAILVARNLPPAPKGKVYEAWLMRDGVPEPVGLFDAPDEGAAAMPMEGSFDDVNAVAVTMEQYGGSPTPTSEPLLTTNL